MPVRLSCSASIVRVEWEGAQTDEELHAFFEELSTALAPLERFAIVYDTRRASVPTARQRRLLAELTRSWGPELRRRCVGVAFVIESAIVRAGLAAVLWLQPMALPNALVGSMNEAYAWCDQRLGRPHAEAS